MTVKQLHEIAPWQRLPARTPIEPLVPESPDQPIEPPNAAVVRRPPVVLVVAPEFGVERRGLSLDRVVPMLLRVGEVRRSGRLLLAVSAVSSCVPV